MSGQGIAQILFYAVVLVALGYPLGLCMARVYTRRASRGRLLAGVERGFYRLVRADPRASRTGRATGRRCSSSASSSRVVLYAIQRAAGAPVPEPGPPEGRAGAHRR